MNSPLHRLYKAKLALLAVLLMVSGIVLLIAVWRFAGVPSWSGLASLLAVEVGAALFTTGLIVVWFEYIDRRDADERATHRLQKVFKQQTPALRDAMLEAFSLNADTLAKVASAETLDGLVHNSLAIQLGDKQLAHDVYNDLREQVVRAGSRNYNAQVSVVLTPWEHGPPSLDGEMFVATIRWQYEAAPLSPVMRFSCVSDEDEYRTLLQDPTSTTTWYFKPVAGLDGASMDAFELVQLAVDGVDQKIRRTSRTGMQIYSVHLGQPEATPGKRTSVSYTFRTLVRRHGHVLHLDIARPTKGLNVELFYGGCGIQGVKVLDYIASAERPRIAQLPASAPTPSVSLAFDGWVWPKSGVGFVWNLE